MTKNAVTLLAKAVKSIDESLWMVVRGSDEYEEIHKARKSLMTVIFENGYELKQGNYRVIKSKVKRSISD